MSSGRIDKLFDFVRDMWNDLDGFAQVFSLPLFVQHIPVDLAGGKVGITIQVFVDEALIVAQIKVGLGSVFGNVDFAVLKRRHGAGVDIDVRIELLRGDLKPARLQ